MRASDRDCDFFDFFFLPHSISSCQLLTPLPLYQTHDTLGPASQESLSTVSSEKAEFIHYLLLRGETASALSR